MILPPGAALRHVGNLLRDRRSKRVATMSVPAEYQSTRGIEQGWKMSNHFSRHHGIVAGVSAGISAPARKAGACALIREVFPDELMPFVQTLDYAIPVGRFFQQGSPYVQSRGKWSDPSFPDARVCPSGLKATEKTQFSCPRSTVGAAARLAQVPQPHSVIVCLWPACARPH